METLTRKEFEEKYGNPDLYGIGKKDKSASYFSKLKEAAQAGIDKTAGSAEEIYEQIQTPIAEQNPLKSLKGATGIGAGIVETAFSPLAPVVEPITKPIGKAIDFVADKISDIPGVQKFSTSKAGEVTADVAETAQNAAIVGGAITGVKGTPKIKAPVSKARTATEEAAGKVKNKVTPSPKTLQTAKGAVRDVVHDREWWIDRNLTQALDLTPGDLNKLNLKTNNDIGRWMGLNNVIGNNKLDTIAKIENFGNKNYKQVRDEIAKVDTLYKQSEVPRFTEILKTVANDTEGKIGLEAVNKRAKNLLAKDEILLADVQVAKEMFDEHFNVYNVLGDAGAGATKQGLDVSRKELRKFIEDEAQDALGVDIYALNNNVATARTLAKAIKTRAPKSFTGSPGMWRDVALALGLTYFSSPVVGLGSVAVYKLITSPTVRLRFARYLDSLDKKQRSAVSTQIRDGNLSDEVKNVLDIQEGDTLPDIQLGRPLKRPPSNLPDIEF